MIRKLSGSFSSLIPYIVIYSHSGADQGIFDTWVINRPLLTEAQNEEILHVRQNSITQGQERYSFYGATGDWIRNRSSTATIHVRWFINAQSHY